jgi:NAD(P)-dependent dehydrogenase (short-subunit alcohol dehydrogenase family)
MIILFIMENRNNPRYDFSNRTVLVTGGTGALGRAITSAFIRCNAEIISSYVVEKERAAENRN